MRDLAATEPDVERAEPRVLQAVYGTILKRLDLSEKHLAQWLRRGISDDVVARHGVRSWPTTTAERRRLAAELYREFGDQMHRVPGWYVRDGKPMLAGDPGWVIPMWDLSTGFVVALRLRSDSNSGPKYYWLSSARHGGTSPGVHARLAWPSRAPRPDDRAEVVRVTEGEAKSIVLAEHTGVPTLSLPGVAMWITALPWLRWLRARRVLLCFDRDRHEKREVAAAYLSAVRGYRRHGYTVHTETWGMRIQK